jgi:multiple sugar transport system substrate-binding protein
MKFPKGQQMTRFIKVAAAATAAMLALAACGGSDDKTDTSTSGGGVSAADVDAALAKGGSLTVWAWDNTLKNVVTGFQAKYPNVKVELVNAGTGDKQYTAVQNAIAAGSGVPDVAQIEYYALPQFALAKSIADLGGYGASGLKSTFRSTRAPWPCSTTRRSSTSTASLCPPPGRSTSRPPASCTRPTRRSTSPVTPATPASPPA